MSINITQFAPVIIPTLCRYEHFVKCIKSLQANTYADKTTLIVGLDYPLRIEHKNGYDKILKYLDNIDGFGDIIIFKRKVNFGARKNSQDLRNFAYSKWDRLIYTEDDNVFSPNFLEFINKGLIMFEHDNNVYAINGYKHFYDIKYASNNYYRQNVDFSAWGCGLWRDKDLLSNKVCSKKYFFKALFNPLKLHRVLRNGNNRTIELIEYAFNYNGYINDCVRSVYMALESKDVIMPIISKVRNIGWDGSGLHCKTNNAVLASEHNLQKIDDQRSFDYVGNGLSYYKENHDIYVGNSYGKMSNTEVYNRLFLDAKRYLMEKVFQIKR